MRFGLSEGIGGFKLRVESKIRVHFLNDWDAQHDRDSIHTQRNFAHRRKLLCVNIERQKRSVQ